MKEEFDDWARVCANDARVRAMWIAEFKAEGYRIVKLDVRTGCDEGGLYDEPYIEEEL